MLLHMNWFIACFLPIPKKPRGTSKAVCVLGNHTLILTHTQTHTHTHTYTHTHEHTWQISPTLFIYDTYEDTQLRNPPTKLTNLKVELLYEYITVRRHKWKLF